MSFNKYVSFFPFPFYSLKLFDLQLQYISIHLNFYVILGIPYNDDSDQQLHLRSFHPLYFL